MYILPRIKKISACCLAVIITLTVVGSTKGENLVTTYANPENASYEAKIKDIEDRQKELDKKISQADDSISGEKEKLDAVNKKIDTVLEKIKTSQEYSTQIEDQMVKLDSQMRDIQNELTGKEEDIKTDVNDFMQRVRVMYVAGSTSYTDVLVSSSDFYDVLMRLELVKQVAAHDNDTINGLYDQKQDIEDVKDKLKKKSEDLQKKSKEYGEQQKKLVDEQTELLKLQSEYDTKIAELENQKSGYLNDADKLESERAKESEKANTTTKKTSKSDSSDSDKTTTTKKTGGKTTTADDSRDPNSSESESATKKPADTTKATEKTETNKPETTTKQNTTTPKPTTTTSKPAPTPPSDNNSNQQKIDIVVNYAKSMVGGKYVWGGEQFGATDCSGLIMLSYRQVGINLPHYAASQANYGKSVSYGNMQPGDVIFFGGSNYSSIYHVAMYIGNGRMVHAENSNTGIVISDVANFSKYNHITCIKRLIY